MLHTQYHNYIFSKILRDAQKPWVRWYAYTCALICVGFFWVLFFTQNEVRWYMGVISVTLSTLFVIRIRLANQIRPVILAQWNCHGQVVSTRISSNFTSVDIKDAYFCTKYNTITQTLIHQTSLIFSTTPFSTNDFRGDIHKALLRGFLKGWVIVSDCEEIHKFLDDNGRTVPNKEYPSISYYPSITGQE